jgi:hypothetical protein
MHVTVTVKVCVTVQRYVTDRGILTDKRRDVLKGEYNGSDVALRNQKSRIRKSAKAAIADLQLIARSDEIESAGTFEPNEMARLVNALMVPSADGLKPRRNFEGTDEEYRAEYLYQLHLHSRLKHELDGFDDLLHDDPDDDWLEPLEELDTQ